MRQYDRFCRYIFPLSLSLSLSVSLSQSLSYVDETVSAQILHRDEDTRKEERWGAGVETQKNVRGEVGGWGRVPFNEPYAPSLIKIYDGA